MAQKHRASILARFSVSASWRGTVLKPMLIHAFSANLPSASQTDKPTIWLAYGNQLPKVQDISFISIFKA